MKVSGFTFLRNAIINGYPFEESIQSLLPIVDEYVVVVGQSDDDTLARVKLIADPKIRIIETQWNESMCDRGYVYGQQKMIAQFNCSGDWAFYLEGDEVLHQDELDSIRASLEHNWRRPEVEALYFNFFHFYGTPQQVGIAGYRQAPRVIRNTIRTIAPDGLFWVVMDKNKKGRYPRACHGGGNIYHYGHCRSVAKMNQKVQQVGKYWGSVHQTFDGYGMIDLYELRPFLGTHPNIMQKWMLSDAEHSFSQSPNYRVSRRDLRNRFRFWLEDFFGLEISKKHFKRVD
jgi:glycosyltransferase involved in cell wall biosynthesis